MTDETAIISRIRQGDEKAFKYLFEHYYAAMCSFARHIVHDGHLAESIVDDVVFNIWENRRSLHVKSSLRTYLLSAVRYRCINEMKSPYRRFSRMQTTIPPGDSTDFVMSLFADARHPLGELIEKELQDIIRESIDELPDECRRVFLKSRTEHMKYAEIADDMHISVNTVKYHIKNALAHLHRRLGGYIKWIFAVCVIDF